MTDRLRQKSTKVSDDDRLAALPDLKREIRQTDPNLSAQEVEKRALAAVGLPTGADVDLDDVPAGGRPRAAARKVGGGAIRAGRGAGKVITASGARKVIFGVMGLSLAIGIFRDFQSGRATTSDVVPRRLIGTFLATLLLMVLAGPAPRVARGLAFLVGFTVVALNTETISKITGSAFGAPEEGRSIEVVDRSPGSDFDRQNPEVRQARRFPSPSPDPNLPPEIVRGRPS